MRHSKGTIEQIRELRLSGHSIAEISEALNIAKTTVLHHTRKVVLPEHVKEIIYRKRGGNAKRKKIREERARVQILQLLHSKHRELLLLTGMLYWAEGNKETFVFTNTDSRMVKIFLKCMRNVFHVSDERIVITLRIFSGMDESFCGSHWEDATRISKSQFRVRWNDGGTRTSSTFGICRITIRKGAFLLHQFKALAEKVAHEYN